MNMKKTIVSTLAAFTLSVLACATNPATGEREFSLMSESQEIAIGQQSDQQVRQEMGVYDDEGLQEYVSTLGQRLAAVSERPNLPWHFTVVDSPVVNAFALPGGYIYLTRGILAYLNSEAEVAGVLGHEIGHVTARHSASQYSRATGAQLGLILGSIFVPAARPLSGLAESALGLLFLRYGRDDELQADELGIRYSTRSGWDPSGVAGMLSTLDRIGAQSEEERIPNWLSTHPAPADRVQRVQSAIQTARAEAPDSRTVNRDVFLQRIDGIVYGDNPDQGILRGSRFLHAVLRFSLDFPTGWSVRNSPAQVVAKRPGADVYLLLQPAEQAQGQSLEDLALSDMREAGFQSVSSGRTTINGLDAFVGTYQGSMENLGRVGLRAAHVLHDRNVYMLAGIAPEAGFGEEENVFNTSIRSFRPLTAAEAADIRPNLIDLYTTRTGDTWESIAERMSKGVVDPATLAIMNGRSISVQPTSGERLKVVIAG
jgi:predicted Zn-dependent protease